MIPFWVNEAPLFFFFIGFYFFSSRCEFYCKSDATRSFGSTTSSFPWGEHYDSVNLFLRASVSLLIWEISDCIYKTLSSICADDVLSSVVDLGVCAVLSFKSCALSGALFRILSPLLPRSYLFILNFPDSFALLSLVRPTLWKTALLPLLDYSSFSNCFFGSITPNPPPILGVFNNDPSPFTPFLPLLWISLIVSGDAGSYATTSSISSSLLIFMNFGE